MKINSLTNPFEAFSKTKIAKIYTNWALKEKVVVKNGVKEKVTNYSRLQESYPDMFMTYAQLMQCYFLNKDEEMPKERKYPLILNNLYTCVIGLAIGLAFRKPIANIKQLSVERAKILYSGPEKEILINGIKTAVPFLISTISFRYLGHVIATPLSTQTTQFLAKKGLINLSEDKKQKKSHFKVDNNA